MVDEPIFAIGDIHLKPGKPRLFTAGSDRAGHVANLWLATYTFTTSSGAPPALAAK